MPTLQNFFVLQMCFWYCNLVIQVETKTKDLTTICFPRYFTKLSIQLPITRSVRKPDRFLWLGCECLLVQLGSLTAIKRLKSNEVPKQENVPERCKSCTIQWVKGKNLFVVKKWKCAWNVQNMCLMCPMSCNHFTVELMLFLRALKVFYWTCVCFWKKCDARTDRQTDGHTNATNTECNEARQILMILMCNAN